eukprot:sb/3461914/
MASGHSHFCRFSLVAAGHPATVHPCTHMCLQKLRRLMDVYEPKPTKIEQYPSTIRAFSSEYGLPHSCMMSHNNICGHPTSYNEYGDNYYSGGFRRFGEWANSYPSRLTLPKYYTPPEFTATDFIECSFRKAVFPVSLVICENFFPGHITSVFGGSSVVGDEVRWIELWRNDEEQSESIYRYEQTQIPLPQPAEAINVILIEFNFKTSEYFSQIESVFLTGYDFLAPTPPLPALTYPLTPNGNTEITPISITVLPNEILVKILRFLDINDLRRISRTSKLFRKLSGDASLYTSVLEAGKMAYDCLWRDLQESGSFRHLHHLDVSWLGANNQITGAGLSCVIRAAPNLRSLSLHTRALDRILDLSNTDNTVQLSLPWLTSLRDLQYLDISHALFTTSSLMTLLSSLDNLEWFKAGSPFLLANQDSILNCLTEKSPGCLRGVELWHWNNLTFDCAVSFIHHHGEYLVELDLGWCTSVKLRDILPTLGSHCPNLVILLLTAHRETRDQGLGELSKGCRKLEQLDLLGSQHITPSGLEVKNLFTFSHSKNLQSITRRVTEQSVSLLSERYPGVGFKHVETYLQRAARNAACTHYIPMATIRLSLASDAPILIPLVNTIYEECEGHLWKPGHAGRITPTVFEQYHRDRELVVAELDGEIVGCVRMGRLEGYREVAMLVVRPDQRGKRIGSQMMEYISDSAKEDGCSRLEIELLYPRHKDDKWKKSVRACSSDEDEEELSIGQRRRVIDCDDGAGENKENIESYFHSRKGGNTSNKTLHDLQLDELDHNKTVKLLSKVKIKYSKEKTALFADHCQYFPQWLIYLQDGFNLCLYGVGSKRQVLLSFAKKHLKHRLHLVINGYFPNLTTRDVLTSITRDMLERCKSAGYKMIHFF